MQVVFVRHGSAEPAGAGGDAVRKLTDVGRGEVRTTAAALATMGLKLERVLTSPLARAVETARIVADRCGGAKIEPAEFLAPPVDAAALAARLAELAGEGVQAVALVGHTPSLESGIGALVADDPRMGLSLSKAGAASVVIPPAESGDRPELQWLMRREQLAIIAGPR